MATFPMSVYPGVSVSDTFSALEFPMSIGTLAATGGIGGGPVAAAAGGAPAGGGGAQGFEAAGAFAPGAGGAPRGPAGVADAAGVPGAAIPA